MAIPAQPIASEDLPRWVPGELLRSSDGCDWNSVALRAYRYGGLDVEVPPLSDFILVCYQEGTTLMERRFEGRWTRTECRPGDVSLLTRSQASHWHWTAPIDVAHVYLPSSLLSRVAADVLDRPVADVRLHDLLRMQDPAVSHIVQAMAHEAGSSAVGGALYAEALGTQLAVHLLRHYASVDFIDQSASGQLPAALRRRLEEFVEERLDQPLSLEELAAVAGMGVWSFCKRFRASFQTSPHGYVIDRRVERARRLLLHSTLALKAVAAECGFSDQAHLTRAVRARLGCTPAALRQGRPH
ncbi:helix-turn-helix domain-containing protein [Paracidovorax oryzae]|uniref:helix-turn-helix domain-containing protein n=1 Tax=Paracidovorax oryzae TaxID=862720 RepID=UPI0004795512|nr:AraC family transcriptional regulator [Paracidovorax oryzae]